MYKYLIIILIIVSVGTGMFYYREVVVCHQPINYDIGTFDTRFGISRDKFLTTIKEAEAVWENKTGQKIFNYQPSSKLKINLVFDQREATTLAANQSKTQIEQLRESYDILVSQYKLAEASYNSDLASYSVKVGQFQQKLNLYNQRVAIANQKGGATPSEYGELQKERQTIQNDQADLEQNRQIVNNEATKLNGLEDQLNQLAHSLNIDVDIHNQKFGQAREFEQGEYSGVINIYQFDTIGDLRLVLTHELGHAMGLEHVSNPKSIMHYLMEKQDPSNPTLSQEDLTAFIQRCSIHVPKLQQLFNLSQLFQPQH